MAEIVGVGLQILIEGHDHVTIKPLQSVNLIRECVEE